jgi:hypothetical protein
MANFSPTGKDLGPSPNERRARRAAETILEDERLTDGLDDPVAQALLDWGVAWAERAAQGEPDEDALGERLRALRRLMRRVRGWAVRPTEMDPAAAAELLDAAVETAACVDPGLVPPAEEEREHFVARWTDYVRDPVGMIADLHALFQQPLAEPSDGARGDS